MAENRAVSQVLQDILRNLQEIVRSEVRLAKIEIRDELKQAAVSGAWIVAGAVGAVSAWIFLLWTVAYALATTLSMWAATLLVALVTAFVAALLILGGIRRAKRIQPVPERTMESVKENLEWMKQPTK
jgi:apolipoprotein N-acyltransferase